MDLINAAPTFLQLALTIFGAVVASGVLISRFCLSD